MTLDLHSKTFLNCLNMAFSIKTENHVDLLRVLSGGTSVREGRELPMPDEAKKALDYYTYAQSQQAAAGRPRLTDEEVAEQYGVTRANLERVLLCSKFKVIAQHLLLSRASFDALIERWWAEREKYKSYSAVRPTGDAVDVSRNELVL